MRRRYTKEEVAKLPRHISCDVLGCGEKINEGEVYYSTLEGFSVCSKHFNQKSAEGQMIYRHVFNKMPPVIGFIHDGNLEYD